MKNIRIVDMLNNQAIDQSYSLKGENYAISDISSLPSNFTDLFSVVQVAGGGTSTGVAKDLQYGVRAAIQILCTATGAGFSSGSVKVQRSNIGGTDTDCWADISGATVSVTGTGSFFIDLPNGGLRLGKFLRLVAASTGGTMDIYAIGVTLSN